MVSPLLSEISQPAVNTALQIDYNTPVRNISTSIYASTLVREVSTSAVLLLLNQSKPVQPGKVKYSAMKNNPTILGHNM